MAQEARTFTGRNQYHEEFEERTSTWLDSQGFDVTPVPIYSHAGRSLLDILKTRNSPTALFTRNHADLYVQHRTLPIEFQLELKTRQTAAEYNHKQDMTIEAVQLAIHVHCARFGVETLYAYWNPYRKKAAGFWASEPPPIREILIPARWSGDALEWMETLFRNTFPGVRRRIPDQCNGSGTPMVIIDETDVVGLPHPGAMIRELLTT